MVGLILDASSTSTSEYSIHQREKNYQLLKETGIDLSDSNKVEGKISTHARKNWLTMII